VTLDADGYPLGALSKAEESIVSGELRRAQLFADAAVNSTAASSELQRARALTRQAI
jgi:hypothetical protein